MGEEKFKKVVNIVVILIMLFIFLFVVKNIWTSHFNLRIRIIQILYTLALFTLIYCEGLKRSKGIYSDNYAEAMYQIWWKLFLISAIYMALEILIGGRYFE